MDGVVFVGILALLVSLARLTLRRRRAEGAGDSLARAILDAQCKAQYLHSKGR